MKRIVPIIIIIFQTSVALGQSVGISGSSFIPNPHALLEMQSDTLGVMFPRLSDADMMYITPSLGPDEQGLTVYNRDTDLYNYWDGNSWVTISTSSGNFVENQNSGQQMADFNIDGDGVTNKMGVGTGLDPILGMHHIYDANPAPGDQLLYVDDNSHQPLLTILDKGRIGIGTSNPNAHAVLDVVDTVGGVIFPRLSASQKATLSATLGAPEEGLMIYDLDQQSYDFWDGSNWSSAGGGGLDFIENQNNSVQPADFNIGGTGVANHLGVGTGLGPVTGLVNIKDNSPTAGSRLLKVDDFIGNPLVTVVDGGQVGLGTSSPTASAILDLTSTTKGFLPPRMTKTQRIAISAVDGMVVYQTTTPDHGLWYFDGIEWRHLAVSGIPLLALEDEDGDTKIDVEQSTDEDIIRFATDGTEYLNIDQGRFNITNTNESLFLGDGAGANHNLAQGRNIMIGHDAGNALVHGSSNILIGAYTMANSTYGMGNVLVGGGSMYYSTSGDGNSALGSNTLTSNVADFNTAIGSNSMTYNTTGTDNTAVGVNSLRYNQTGSENTASGFESLKVNNGDRNSAFGRRSMQNNGIGNDNVAVGHNAMYSNTTADENVALGKSALYSNSTGIRNVAIGYRSLYHNTSPRNVAIGTESLYNNTEGQSNTSIGTKAMYGNTIGHNNTAVGSLSLFYNTDGQNNTATGKQSLYRNTSGGNNTATGLASLLRNTVGSFNSAFGGYALFDNDDGVQNVAVGFAALKDNTSGDQNTAIGYRASWLNLSGSRCTSVGFKALYNNLVSENTAIGSNALYSNVDGSQNTALGHNSLHSNTSAHNNTAIGFQAMEDNTVGWSNTATGSQSMANNSSGSRNTAFGASTLRMNSVGFDNSAFGYQALNDNTGGGNTAVGSFALTSNTHSTNNTAVGSNGLMSNVTGGSNTAVGANALSNNNSGFANIGIGSNALTANVDGHANTTVGTNSMNNHTTGSFNTAVGSSVLSNSISGTGNTGIGFGSLRWLEDAVDNTSVGYDAGSNIISGSQNSCFGRNSNVGISSVNSTALGHGAWASASNSVVLGNSSVTSIGGYAAWTNLSDGRVKENIQRNVPGLEFIDRLTPVSYNLNLEALAEIKGIPDSVRFKESERMKEQIIYTGLIAQDVEKAAQEIGFEFSGVDAPQNENDPYGLRYAEFVAPLIKAVQELHEMNTMLEQKVFALENERNLNPPKIQE